MKTMTAKYNGCCAGCGGNIRAGDTIAHAGRRRSYHEACAPAARGVDPGQSGVVTVRTSSGWTGTQNRRGRCEDAPCCGCCTF